MKKKAVIFIAAVIVIFIALLFITGKYPPPEAEQTGGTIGKVEKYRKVQMTEKDIILRSEVTSDTSKLAQAIYGLTLFNAFAKEYSQDLNTIAAKMENSKLAQKDAGTVKEFSRYIDENRKSVDKIITLLGDFYTKDTSDFSIDIEKKLIDFHNFVQEVVERDSSITALVKGIEKTVKADPQRKDDEFKKLKNIHDQLLIKSYQLAVIVGFEMQAQTLAKSPLYDVANLGLAVSDELKNVSLDKQQVQSTVLANKDLANCYSKQVLSNSGIGVVIFNQVLSKEALAALKPESGPGQLGYYYGQETLGMDAVLQLGIGVASYAYSNAAPIALQTISSKEIQNVVQYSAVASQVLANSSVGIVVPQ